MCTAGLSLLQPEERISRNKREKGGLQREPLPVSPFQMPLPKLMFQNSVMSGTLEASLGKPTSQRVEDPAKDCQHAHDDEVDGLTLQMECHRLGTLSIGLGHGLHFKWQFGLLALKSRPILPMITPDNYPSRGMEVSL